MNFQDTKTSNTGITPMDNVRRVASQMTKKNHLFASKYPVVSKKSINKSINSYFFNRKVSLEG